MKECMKRVIVFIIAFCIGISVYYGMDYIENQLKPVQQKSDKVFFVGCNFKINTNDKIENELKDNNLPKLVRRSDCFPITPLFRAVPQYPKEAKEKKIFGDVVVEVDINKFGNVAKATVLKGHPLLQQVSLDAAYKTTFAVSRLNGNPVPVTTVLTYRFRLD